MEEILKLTLGVLLLVMGIPLGDYLRKITLDEQKDGRIWFKILTTLGILGGFIGLILREDWVLFTFFFIAIVTSRNLVDKKRRNPKRSSKK
ncbi:MAG: hypothetical protein Q8Q04_00860 [archaeon]|nr:hypothetical protein [archaeon]